MRSTECPSSSFIAICRAHYVDSVESEALFITSNNVTIYKYISTLRRYWSSPKIADLSTKQSTLILGYCALGRYNVSPTYNIGYTASISGVDGDGSKPLIDLFESLEDCCVESYSSQVWSVDSGGGDDAGSFCRAMLCIGLKRGYSRHAVSLRPSVCLSVKFVDHVETNKHIFEFFSPSVATPF